MLRGGQHGRTLASLMLVCGLFCVVCYLILPPLGTLLLGAMTDTPPGMPPHVTMSTIVRAWQEPGIYPAIAWSLVFAAVSSTSVLVLAALLAWIVERTDARVRLMTDLLTLAPIVMPAVLLVNGWILLLGPRSGMINLMAMSWFGLTSPPFDVFSFGGMVWVAMLQELPLAFLWLWPSFRAMNPELEEAGLAAGAGMLRVTCRITLPILRPALTGAWIIFFIYAFGSLSVPLLIGQPAGIFLFPVEIYLAATQFPTDLNIAGAYSLVYLVVSFIGIALNRRVTRNTEQYATIRGRAFRPRRLKLGAARPLAEIGVAMLLGAVAVLPFLVLLWNAFLPFPQLPSVASLRRLGWENFVAVWHYGPAIRALVNSLWLGLLAGVIATILALGMALCNVRMRRFQAAIAVIDQLAAIPVALPGLVIGIGMTWFYLDVDLPVYGTPLILLLAYLVLHLPYAVRIMSAGLAQLHVELEEAARVSGAGEMRLLFRVVLPLLIPSLLTSCLYVALRSFREYAASVFLAGPGLEVVAVLVLDLSQSGNSNILAAYTVIITVVMTLAAVLFNRMQHRTTTLGRN